jgi:hypothetical protein
MALSSALVLVGVGRASAEYQPSPSTLSGRVSGVVRLQGSPPALAANPVYKHTKECGAAIADERLVLGADERFRMSSSTPSTSPLVVDRHPERLLLDNRECAFVPHVMSASLGQTLSIRNSDPFLMMHTCAWHTHAVQRRSAEG